MTNLIQRIFGRRTEERNPKIETRVTYDEAKPFFQSLGIKVDEMNFPKAEYRSSPFYNYSLWFDNVKAMPIKVDDALKTVIIGNYQTQNRVSYQDDVGVWRPGEPERYSFRIEDNKLTIIRGN